MHAYLPKNALDVPWIFRMKYTTKVKQLVLSSSLSLLFFLLHSKRLVIIIIMWVGYT